MRESPDKGWKRSGLDNLIRKLLKKWMSIVRAQCMIVVFRGLCVGLK